MKFQMTVLLAFLPLALSTERVFADSYPIKEVNPPAHTSLDGCSVNEIDAQKVQDFPGSGYWMQSGGDLITHTSEGGTQAQYFDSETKKSTRRDRDIDPFPLPEGDLIIHPAFPTSGFDGLRFYKASDLTEKGDQAKPIFTDKGHVGWYESVGVTARDINHRTVRVLTAQGNGNIQDYNITRNRDSSYDFQKAYAQPIPICQNLERSKLDWETPVLSKDGQFVATRGNTSGSGTTKIFSIATPSGDCKLVADLGSETDKVSFRNDSKKIAYITQVKHGTKYLSQLFEFDVDTKKTRVSSTPVERVLYQGYKPDGTLMYTRQKDTVTGSADDEGSEMVFLGKNWHESDSASTVAAARVIGKLWAQKCKLDIDDDQALVVGSRLNQKSCGASAKSYEAQSADLKDATITSTDLLAFCVKDSTTAAGRRTTK